MTMIDLRSDTLTKPTPEMMQAMMSAEVGDEVFEEDPTVRKLENKLAEMFGMDAGLFCPSGTMTNQIAIRMLTQPQDEVICDKRAHIYNYEGGGIAYNSLISTRLLDGDRGRITAKMVEENINPDDVHFPQTSLVALENTMNKGGGCFYDLSEIEKIAKVCQQNELKLHLDGARFFNAIVETGESPADYGKHFDSISICLSKGLGAPIGSVLLTKNENLKKAKRIRKTFGVGMRQVGYLAAAGLYALENNIARLKEDHKKAREIEATLKTLSFVKDILPVATNIVIFEVDNSATMVELLQKKGIKSVSFGPQHVRFVTHLDFSDDMLEEAIKVLKGI
ncbi:MAG: aminotransferase class I/II-fold pyridoxal phosphate-dependent enzyme [Flammeovirgaceae bacterium]|nr:aminotransferase class I/II-fold pyridoxal phosphate-dependent enzyme [Flammeovirgaceae bacterium]